MHRHSTRGTPKVEFQKWKSHMADLDAAPLTGSSIAQWGHSRHLCFFLRFACKSRKMAGPSTGLYLPRWNRLSLRLPWKVHNEADDARWKSPRYPQALQVLQVLLKRYNCSKMSWKNISPVIENRLFLGKSVVLYSFNPFTSINLWLLLASWLRARLVQWQKTTSHILSPSVQILSQERSQHQEYAICASQLKMSITQTSWSTYLRHADLSTRPSDLAALYSSTVFKASHEARQLSLHIVGFWSLFFNWQLPDKHAVMWSRRIRTTQALDIVRNGERDIEYHFNNWC